MYYSWILGIKIFFSNLHPVGYKIISFKTEISFCYSQILGRDHSPHKYGPFKNNLRHSSGTPYLFLFSVLVQTTIWKLQMLWGVSAFKRTFSCFLGLKDRFPNQGNWYWIGMFVHFQMAPFCTKKALSCIHALHSNMKVYTFLHDFACQKLPCICWLPFSS